MFCKSMGLWIYVWYLCGTGMGRFGLDETNVRLIRIFFVYGVREITSFS
jgi:hypothetical protein